MALHRRTGFIYPPAMPILDMSDTINGGLVAWWRMDANDFMNNTLLDRSGNNFNTDAMPNNVLKVPGKVGAGLSFGTSGASHIGVSKLNSAFLKGTISYWMKTPSSVTGYPNTFSTNFNEGSGNTGIRTEMDATLSYTFVFGDVSSYTSISLSSAMAGGLLALNSWYFIGITWDSTLGVIGGYINGRTPSSAGSGGRIPPAWSTFVLGNGYLNGGNRYWTGFIDEFRVHNRVLQIGEFNRMYADTTGGLGLAKPRRVFGRGLAVASAYLPRAVWWRP